MTSTLTPWWAGLWLAVGYLAGTIPFGLLLTRWAGLGDVRTIGSGNIGATNVLRTGNRALAALTLALDALKATVPILAARAMSGEAAGLAAGLGAFAGHLFPIWLRFKGGKGVATYLGLLLGLAWPLALAFAGVWLAMAASFRRSSLAALTAAALAPLWSWWLGLAHLVWPLAALAVAIGVTHRANIARLLRGTEPAIGKP